MNETELSEAPAFMKLLGFWWAANRRMRRSLSEYAKGPVHLVTLEEFSRCPKAVIEKTYHLADWKDPPLNFDRVRPVRAGWRSETRRWREAFERVGIPRELLPGSAFASDELDAALMSEAKSSAGLD